MADPKDKAADTQEEEAPEIVLHSADEEELPDCGCHLAVNAEE